MNKTIKDADKYFNRGVAKLQLGKFKESIKDFDKSIELNPQHALAYKNRGLAKYNLGKSEDAIKDFERAIELNPNDSESLVAKEEILKEIKEKGHKD